MTSVVLSSPPSAFSPFERWHRYFLGNRDSPGAFPWHDSYRLTASELRLVGRSIQQFQLGEWARGRGFMRRASSHPVFAADSWFLPALKLFIAEEQGHSGILGCFLDRERIPRLTIQGRLVARHRRMRHFHFGEESAAHRFAAAEPWD